MNPLGSREEDPLLKNDPLAPEEDSEPVGSSTNGDSDEASRPSEEDVSPSRHVSPSSEEGEEAPNEEGKSVFASRSDASTSESGTSESGDARSVEPSLSEGGEARVLVSSEEEVSAEKIAALNEAFDQGWRLARVVVQDEASSSRGAISEAGVTLAFVLQRRAHR